LGAFGYVSILNEDELPEKYTILKFLGGKLKDFTIYRLPGYAVNTIKDMGIEGHNVKGYRICIPPLEPGSHELCLKFKGVVKRFMNPKSDVVILDPGLGADFFKKEPKIKISRGLLYPPYVFMDAIRDVSSLMGINFSRCNICIVDASTTLGVIAAELLVDKVLCLTLCTKRKNEVMKMIDGFIGNSGLSPAVVSNYKKAVMSCDILIYTGEADIHMLTSYIHKKTLVVNLTGENLKLEKDLLVIDEVILRGQKDAHMEEKEDIGLLTSSMWEGALLSLSDVNEKVPCGARAKELGEFGKSLGIRLQREVGNGRLLDKHIIYRYR